MQLAALLQQFHAAAGDAALANAALERACQGCDAALLEGVPLGAVADALEQVLGSPRNLLSATWLVQRVAEPGQAERYQEAVRGASERLETRIDRLLLELQRRVAGASAEGLGRPELALLAVRARRVALPDDDVVAQLTRLRLEGIEASLDAHRRALWAEPYGALESDGETITVEHRNARALMRDGRAAVRRDAARVTSAHALRLDPVLLPAKRERIAGLDRMAKLAGYGDAVEQLYAESGLTPASVRALFAQAPRIMAFCARYFTWKQRRLGLAQLTEVDLAARAVSAPADLSIERVLDAARATSGVIDACYPAILDELTRGGCLITTPSETRSAEWACLVNLAGGLPIVHVPYFADYETYVAAAHELGHACQITASARRSGALLQYVAPMWHSETFSLRFELDAVDLAIERAPTAQLRELWIEAAIDQWLHFVRTLQVTGRFEHALLLEGVSTRARGSELRAQAWRALSPPLLEPAVPGEDARWLLDDHAEYAPCSGFSYGLAMLIAYRSKLSGAPLVELADRAPTLGIAEACARYLGFDIEDPAAFEPAWQRIEALFAQLT